MSTDGATQAGPFLRTRTGRPAAVHLLQVGVAEVLAQDLGGVGSIQQITIRRGEG